VITLRGEGREVIASLYSDGLFQLEKLNPAADARAPASLPENPGL
jgi:hypothetical protein